MLQGDVIVTGTPGGVGAGRHANDGLRYQLLPAVTAVSIGVPNLTPHRLTVESAERVGRRIVDAYLAPDKTFVEIRDRLDTGSIDILGEFSEACRV